MSSKGRGYYQPRRAANEEARRGAERHAQRWSDDELDLQLGWDGTEPELATIAELVGRTTEACRTMYYTRRRGTTTVTTTESTTSTTTTTYRGWMESDGDGWD